MAHNSSEEKPRPRDITLDRETHELRIAWQDDHPDSVFPLNALREACPCASCRGGHDRMGPEHDPDIIFLKTVRDRKVVDIRLAGNYALQITWDDGHDAGFYTWEYLRRICPCEICEAQRHP